MTCGESCIACEMQLNARVYRDWFEEDYMGGANHSRIRREKDQVQADNANAEREALAAEQIQGVLDGLNEAGVIPP